MYPDHHHHFPACRTKSLLAFHQRCQRLSAASEVPRSLKAPGNPGRTQRCHRRRNLACGTRRWCRIPEFDRLADCAFRSGRNVGPL